MSDYEEGARPKCRHRKPAPYLGAASRAWKRAKSYLAGDFGFRCVYCLAHEAQFRDGYYCFSVDHFRPKQRPEFLDLRNVYENLLYACIRCNTNKGKKWPKPQEEAEGKCFVDPCQEDIYPSHLEDRGQGLLIAHTIMGEYTRDTIKLNGPEYVQSRARLNRCLQELGGQLKEAEDRKRNTWERLNQAPPLVANRAETLQEFEFLQHRIRKLSTWIHELLDPPRPFVPADPNV